MAVVKPCRHPKSLRIYARAWDATQRWLTDVEWCRQCGAFQQRWDGKKHMWMKPLRYRKNESTT
jgi:hypothetical protein